MSTSSICPSWGVMSLVSYYLDPISLATSSIVCKQWFECMTTDHVWEPLCLAKYPSLLNLKIVDTTVPYRRLYSLRLEAAKRRVQTPPKPRFALEELDFLISMQNSEGHAVTLKLQGEDILVSSNGLFRFEFNTSNTDVINIGASKGLKVSLNVVLKSWKGVFCMMEAEYKKLCGVDSGKVEGWFTKELPRPGCCGADMCRGVMAELILRFESCGGESGGMLRLEKVNVGLMSMLAPKYLQVDDGIRYLEIFLL